MNAGRAGCTAQTAEGCSGVGLCAAYRHAEDAGEERLDGDHVFGGFWWVFAGNVASMTIEENRLFLGDAAGAGRARGSLETAECQGFLYRRNLLSPSVRANERDHNGALNLVYF